jgi:hypothetical protein
VWGYIDEDSFEEHMMEFEAATPFADGYAAVCKDGKWAVISSSLSYVTDFIYDEVAVDDYGTCSVGKRVFAKRDGAYYLVNTKGEELSGEYEDAKPFLSSGGYAAVCMNGKWGLVDSDGTIVLECRFEELDSSNEGFAGYKKGDLWGYITVKGEIMIEANYAEVKAFTDDGYAYVSNGSNWYLIQLYLYE